MDYYKVLLVDDEPEVIEAVIRKMDWHGLGFEVIGHAQNGEEALEMAENNVPDVVMTDIKMPFMDGLTLARKLKESYGGIKVIIFSGFDEFEYAREAIKLEVEEYILKPIKLDELTVIFKRTKEALDKEREEKTNLNMLKEYYQKSLPFMQDQFYIGLLEGRIARDQIESFCRDYQIELNAPHYVVSVLLFEMSKEAEEKMERGLMQFSMKRLADEALDGKCRYVSFLYLDQIIYILMLDDPSTIKECTDNMDRICKLANRILKMDATAGIGTICDGPDMLQNSYTGAKNAAFFGESHGGNQAIYIDYLQPTDSGTVDWNNKGISAIVREIRVGNQESLETAIENFMQDLSTSQMPVSQFHIILVDLLTELYKMCSAYQVDTKEIFGADTDFYRLVNQFSGMEAIKQWLLESGLKIRKYVSRERKNSAKVMIDKAVDYLEENYSDSDLSVEKICGVLNVSGAYFCTIFKKETGKTFLNYLTDVRMEAAINLLEETEEKSYVISEKVGYTEPNYFSYVFKKKYGMAPSKYRKTRLEQDDNKD